MNMKLFWVVLIGLLLIGVGYIGFQLGNNGSNSGADNKSNTNNDQDTSQSSKSGKTADYSNKGLSEFPKEVLSDKSITNLDLSGNSLTGALPAEIHDLVNLETLDVSDNLMTGIPAEVGQLRKLKTLDYSNNQITGLPMELGNLTQLDVLDFRGNNVSQQDLNQIRAKLTSTDIRL